MRILIINGPNLNMLGRRAPEHYAAQTLEAIEQTLCQKAQELGCELTLFQSNHEGEIIDFIQRETPASAGILINPGALTHYGYSLHDALADCRLPVVEVHLSNIYAREDWRRHSVISDVTIGQVIGFKAESYSLGLVALTNYIRSQSR